MGALMGSVLVGETWYRAGADLDEDVAAQIGEHAFEYGEHPYPRARAKFVAARDGKAVPGIQDDGGDGEPSPPPMGGPGSGVEAWVLYAGELDVDVDGLDKRDDVVAAIKAAGHPVEKQ